MATGEHHPINLIRVFDFYLALMFVIGLVRRWEVYWDGVRVLLAVRGRWPRLMDRLGEHHSLLLNKSFFRPVGLTLALWMTQIVCSRVIWPRATLTVAHLRDEWWWLLVIFVPMAAMLAVDMYFVFRVGGFDRAETEKYMDYAEGWLTSWKTPLIRAATLGFVDPHRIVDREVRTSLTKLQLVINWSLWWVSAQMALRITFGLTLWTVWAVQAE